MTTTDEDDQHATRTRSRWRPRRIVGLSVLAVLVIVAVVTSFSPWPSAMLIRAVFEKSGADTAAEMTEFVPDVTLRTESGIQYAKSGDEAGAATTLDLFTPASAGEALPTVVWVHGGAWIAGSNSDVEPYLRILAAEGYTTIALNYSLGPEATYPTAPVQLNEALGYVLDHADELSVDPTQIVLAGDSAGAQLASQLATFATNPEYADLLSIDSALDADQVAAVVLNCGVYDMSAMAELDGIFAWGLQVALWAYTGTKGWSAEYSGATMSTIDFVTEDFPTTYISGGNGDQLTWLESIPMAHRLRALDVDVTEVFWPAQHEPALPHEYQFHLKRDEAQHALKETIAFLGKVTTPTAADD